MRRKDSDALRSVGSETVWACVRVYIQASASARPFQTVDLDCDSGFVQVSNISFNNSKQLQLQESIDNTKTEVMLK